MGQALEQIEGVLERIIYSNEETHYCVGEVKTDASPHSIKVSGKLPGIQCGETLKLAGNWHTHPTHGRQFKIEKHQSQLPSTVYGIRKYLGSGLVPGIGKQYAENIVDHFGKETLKVISEESARLKEVAGIGTQRAKSIKKAWDEQAALRNVMMFLRTYGITTAQCLRLVKQYGENTESIVKNDPYRMVRDVDYIGFATADQIALNLGFSNASTARVDAGILHAMNQLETDGHTAIPKEQVQRHAVEHLQVSADLIKSRIDQLLGSKDLKLGASALQSPVLYRAEQNIARHLDWLRRSKSNLPKILIEKAIVWAQDRAGFSFAPEQAEAIRATLSSKLTLLTGGPGTGKTTILSSIVQILRAKKVKLVLTAPTGRAAQRMSESTKMHAQTIHRLLEFDPSAGGFTRNDNKPINADFVIVDECSMIDTRLASSLLKAIPSSAHLLLVGDVNQLPSVGPGNILKDLITSKWFHLVCLEHIFRQGHRSGIVTTAHNVLKGSSKAIEPEPLDRLDPDIDFHFLHAPTPELCLETIISLCQDCIPKRLHFHPSNDTQILAPMHKGSAGVSSINTAVQKAINPSSSCIVSGAYTYAPGDKVIQTRNNYDKNIFNGDIGRVISIDPAKGCMDVQFDTARVELERGDLNYLQLAYAISIHKSQGSEFPVVIIPVLKQHYIMLQRNLIYTAITRGRKHVIIVGDPAAYSMAVRNKDSSVRHTDLLQKLSKTEQAIA